MERGNPKQQAAALEGANELQYAANKLQQKLIDETEKNNRITSKHNTAIRWLTAAIVLLTVITLLTNYNQTGRYAILKGGTDFVWVVDTKTSQLWLRGGTSSDVVNLGTIENPKKEVMTNPKK